MATRLRPFDFGDEDFDAALHFGAADWPGGDHLRLKTEQLVAVCAPSVLNGHTVTRADELSALPLLHIATRPTAWKDWFAAQDIRDAAVDGTVYDQFSTIIQAVIHGLGVALLPKYLVEQDLATRRMVIAFGQSMQSDGAYYLVWPSERSNDPALRNFRTWLAGQSEDEDALPR